MLRPEHLWWVVCGIGLLALGLLDLPIGFGLAGGGMAELATGDTGVRL